MKTEWMQRAIELARIGMEKNEGGPFGCVIVKEGVILAEGNNRVMIDHDPTAHAEVIAIRRACEKLGDFQLTGCDLYTSCEPCPMCLGAIYWARVERIFYAGTRKDAAHAGFDDEFIYEEFSVSSEARKIPMTSLERDKAVQVFKSWIRR